MGNEKEISFKGKIIRQILNSNDYKVYAVEVDKDIYCDIKYTKYGNVVISGEIHELSMDTEYEITAVGQNTKYGYSYKIINIRR